MFWTDISARNEQIAHVKCRHRWKICLGFSYIWYRLYVYDNVQKIVQGLDFLMTIQMVWKYHC